MTKLFIPTVAIALLAAPAVAQADTGNQRAAKAECREERREDSREFQFHYGGSGATAIRRCVRIEIADAKRDCRQERRFDTAEYRVEYGTGRQAMRRCVRDELR